MFESLFYKMYFWPLTLLLLLYLKTEVWNLGNRKDGGQWCANPASMQIQIKSKSSRTAQIQIQIKSRGKFFPQIQIRI